MMPACIVWACPRRAGPDETFCERHAPDSAWQRRDRDADLAYIVAEGLTLAEVSALTGA